VHFEVYVDPGEVTLRLGSAVIFGLLLGIDREVRGYDAGMRTHMLVALGAAVMTLIAFELYDDLRKHRLDTAGDPLRVIEGVVTAVGFLGGGAIIRGNGEVQGLTTAANIWLCGAVGLACGAGHYLLAAITFGFTVTIVTGMYLVKRWLASQAARLESKSTSRAAAAVSVPPLPGNTEPR
jgi:putative Mg2+ transporter-C (MgtC) family protein